MLRISSIHQLVMALQKIKPAMLLPVVLVLLFFSNFAYSQQSGLKKKGSKIIQGGESVNLDRVRVLVKYGALGLARNILETSAPPQQANKTWLNWERQLWMLYETEGLWEQLYDRSLQIPPVFPDSFKHEARGITIKALTRLGNNKRARQLIRDLVWQQTGVSTITRRMLRRRLVESYLADSLIKDAKLAAGLFQKDYRPQDREWLLLVARIDIEAGEPSSAVNLLAPMDNDHARLLRLYARFLDKSLKPDEVIKKAAKMVEKIKDIALRPALYSIMASVNKSVGNPIAMVDNIESYLEWEDSSPALPFQKYAVQDLFNAYAAVARRAGNDAGLLIGVDKKWLRHARKIKKSNPVESRSIYAWLIAISKSKDVKRTAKNAYVKAVINAKHIRLLRRLFHAKSDLGNLSVSGAVALKLSNIALEQGEIQLAADAVTELTEKPPGITTQNWLLQSARITILAGRYEVGSDYLKRWMAMFKRLKPAETDLILQPIFDLQSTNNHKDALELLKQVKEKSPALKYQREVTFWLAESFSGLKQYISAAENYLLSALYKNNGFDPWGQAAQYRAAAELANAGMLKDARRIYNGLLELSDDPIEKQSIRQKLQKLWLKDLNNGEKQQTD